MSGKYVFRAACKQLGVMQSVFEITGNVRVYVMYQPVCVHWIVLLPEAFHRAVTLLRRNFCAITMS